MNPDPDYSAAYVVARAPTTASRATASRSRSGAATSCASRRSRRSRRACSGLDLDDVSADPGAFWRHSPATASCAGSGRRRASSTWRRRRSSTRSGTCGRAPTASRCGGCSPTSRPSELVACVDFRYLTDALDPGEARELLEERAPGAARRAASEMRARRLPRLHDLDRLARLPRRRRSAGSRREAVAEGWGDVKMKVGGHARGRRRRGPRSCARRSAPSGALMMDANQVWDVPEAIERTQRARRVRALLDGGADEPRRRARPRRDRPRDRADPVATGEHCHNRVIFKQLLQAEAIGVCQVDACRLGGVNEVLAVLLLAAKFGVPVCPHAGGVGLCEFVQHISMFDYVVRRARAWRAACSSTSTTCTSTSSTRCACAAAATSRPSARLLGGDPRRLARRVRVPRRCGVEVVIVTPIQPEQAERIAAEEGVELTYLPELLPTERWSNDGSGEGGVALRRPALGRAARARRGRLGHPGGHGRGPRRPRRGGRRGSSGSRPATPAPASSSARRSQLAPDDARARDGHHVLRRPRRPAGRVRALRPARVRQGLPTLLADQASATGRRAAARRRAARTARC